MCNGNQSAADDCSDCRKRYVNISFRQCDYRRLVRAQERVGREGGPQDVTAMCRQLLLDHLDQVEGSGRKTRDRKRPIPAD